MNFRTIWKNRIKRSRQKYWEGSAPQPCFDYENIKESNRFLTDNFKDLVLEDFFNILYDFKNNDFEELIIHCQAGVSRSHAIALFAAKYYAKDENLYKTLIEQEGKVYGGNRYVFNKLENYRKYE